MISDGVGPSLIGHGPIIMPEALAPPSLISPLVRKLRRGSPERRAPSPKPLTHEVTTNLLIIPLSPKTQHLAMGGTSRPLFDASQGADAGQMDLDDVASVPTRLVFEEGMEETTYETFSVLTDKGLHMVE